MEKEERTNTHKKCKLKKQEGWECPVWKSCFFWIFLVFHFFFFFSSLKMSSEKQFFSSQSKLPRKKNI